MNLVSKLPVFICHLLHPSLWDYDLRRKNKQNLNLLPIEEFLSPDNGGTEGGVRGGLFYSLERLGVSNGLIELVSELLVLVIANIG